MNLMFTDLNTVHSGDVFEQDQHTLSHNWSKYVMLDTLVVLLKLCIKLLHFLVNIFPLAVN